MPIEILDFARDASHHQLEPNDSATFTFRVKNTFGPVIKCVNVSVSFDNLPDGMTIKEGLSINCGDLLPDQEVKKQITIITTNMPNTGGKYKINIIPQYSIDALSTPLQKSVTVEVAHN